MMWINAPHNGELKEGTRVRLRPDSKWADPNEGSRNPLDTDGVVLAREDEDGWIYVKWQIGCQNSYPDEGCDMLVMADDSPQASDPDADDDKLVAEIHQPPADDLGAKALDIIRRTIQGSL